jgi:GntR family transcriptional regulator/MocR family aminotransferase
MDFALLLINFIGKNGQPKWSRQRQLHECLRGAIRAGSLGSGQRLPGTRQLAAELAMARNTVLYAYEQLATEGFVRTERRGTYVAELTGAPAPSAPIDAPPPGLAGLSRRWHAPAILSDASLMSAFAPGVPALDAFPVGVWRRLLDRAWRAMSPAGMNYGDANGAPELRAAIAAYLRTARGVVCEPAQVFITDGSQNGLDLCAHAFADVGELAWMENPGYKGALVAFGNAQLHVKGIAVDEDGIAPTEADWRERPPKLIYVTPSHQYPLGGVLSLSRRLALIERAKAAGALIIEDDYDSEFRYDGPPLSAMQGLEAHAPVIYMGTFSKTMFPALRIGYMVVPAALVAPLTLQFAQSAPRGRTAEQLALAEFITSGQFGTHLRRMRRLYRQRRDALAQALERHVGAAGTVHGCLAGMHLALLLDEAVDDRRASARAREQGLVAHALSGYLIGERDVRRNGFVLGYSQVPVELMDELVQALAKIVVARAGSRG